MMKIILRDLALGPATRKELELLTGADKRTVCRHMKAALEAKLVHIAAYDPGHGGVRVYALGKGKNAERRDQQQINADKSRRWRARQKEKRNAIATLQDGHAPIRIAGAAAGMVGSNEF